MPAQARSKRPSDQKDGLHHLDFYIGRVYYNFIGLLERRLEATGLSEYIVPGMGSILFALFENDDCIIRDLAIRVRHSPSTLTGMLNRMKRSGLIEQHRDSQDGRAARITLTPLGRSLEPRCRALLRELESILAGGMSRQEAETFKDLLSRADGNIHRAASSLE
jgi:DNA-binding MarR family transcriptional regulator